MKTPAVIHPARHAFQLSTVTALMLSLGLITVTAAPSTITARRRQPTLPPTPTSRPTRPRPC